MSHECSERSCTEKAVKEIEIRGESHLTDKKYYMWVYVCQNHYDMEKNAKTPDGKSAIFREKSL